MSRLNMVDMSLTKWVLAVILLSSCASVQNSNENRDIEQLYQGAGVERYFLPDVPLWASFSASADCRLDGIVRYLNFETIRDSYSLEYEEVVHLQHMLNRRFYSFKSDSDKQLYLKDETFIFHNVYEQVSGGGRDFLLPQFPRISLVWIDPYMDNPSKIGKILETEEVGQGHPVLVSSCMSTNAMEALLEKNGWDRFGVKLIGQEMFTPFRSNYELGTDFTLDFSKFLPNKELRLFAPRMPPHFKGINRLIKI